MRLPKTSTRPRIVIVALALLGFGLSTTAIGAMLRAFAGQAGRVQLASQGTSYAVSGSSIPVRYLAPDRDFAPTDFGLVDADGAVGSRPLVPARNSGLTLVLVGLSLVGGAVFMRRKVPVQVSSPGPDVATTRTADSVPAKRSAQ
jgi:hypothetical protein